MSKSLSATAVKQMTDVVGAAMSEASYRRMTKQGEVEVVMDKLLDIIANDQSLEFNGNTTRNQLADAILEKEYRR